MGISAAYMWATIYFAVHKNQSILPTYRSHLPVYKHFIDDIVGVWVPSNNQPNSWADFEYETNNFGILN